MTLGDRGLSAFLWGLLEVLWGLCIGWRFDWKCLVRLALWKNGGVLRTRFEKAFERAG